MKPTAFETALRDALLETWRHPPGCESRSARVHFTVTAAGVISDITVSHHVVDDVYQQAVIQSVRKARLLLLPEHEVRVSCSYFHTPRIMRIEVHG